MNITKLDNSITGEIHKKDNNFYFKDKSDFYKIPSGGGGGKQVVVVTNTLTSLDKTSLLEANGYFESPHLFALASNTDKTSRLIRTKKGTNTVGNSFYSTVLNGQNNMLDSESQNNIIFTGEISKIIDSANSSILNSLGSSPVTTIKDSTNSTVIGGLNNQIINSESSVIISGISNYLESPLAGLILSGTGNTGFSGKTTIINGRNNYSTGFCVTNGYGCYSKENYSTVLNGFGNTANGPVSTVVNGNGNETTNTLSCIVNGEFNECHGVNCTILNGTNNSFDNLYSNSTISCSTNIVNPAPNQKDGLFYCKNLENKSSRIVGTTGIDSVVTPIDILPNYHVIIVQQLNATYVPTIFLPDYVYDVGRVLEIILKRHPAATVSDSFFNLFCLDGDDRIILPLQNNTDVDQITTNSLLNIRYVRMVCINNNPDMTWLVLKAAR